MQTWAQRGLRTALVTGGLLVLGTGIASANENVNPDLPPSPLDSPIGGGIGQLPSAPVQAIGVASTPPDTEEATSLDHIYPTPGNSPLRDTDATNVITMVAHSGDAEWAPLSGDLFDPPATQLPVAGNVFRVPLGVVGRAVGHTDVPATQGADEFGPSDAAFQLLGANQVPVIPDLFTVPRLPGLPVLDGSATQVFQAVGQHRPATPATQDLPTPGNTPFQPVSGELPVSGSLPAVTRPVRPPVPHVTAPGVASLPDLPPVPTLPAMPPLHDGPSTQSLPTIPAVPGVPSVPNLPVPHVSGPLTSGLPTTQDVPAGAAQQLMAQLRGLISELEHAGGGQLHPLNVTALQAPDLQPPTL